MAGRLVLVVGPSGAGKDTLIVAAKAALANDSRFAFPRRVVTRAAVAALEDHESVNPEDFARCEAEGGYALSWRAHGLCYGLPASLMSDIGAGRIVVVNVSRAVIDTARAKFPEAVVIVVDAAPEIRARRLATRGREDEAEIAARLRREGSAVPDGAIAVANAGMLEAGVRQFVSTLQAVAQG
jgi:ribose 1,5-bisphosphokinase